MKRYGTRDCDPIPLPGIRFLQAVRREITAFGPKNDIIILEGMICEPGVFPHICLGC